MTKKGVWRNTILDTLAPYAEDPKVNKDIAYFFKKLSSSKSEEEMPYQKKSKKNEQRINTKVIFF